MTHSSSVRGWSGAKLAKELEALRKLRTRFTTDRPAIRQVEQAIKVIEAEITYRKEEWS